ETLPPERWLAGRDLTHAEAAMGGDVPEKRQRVVEREPGVELPLRHARTGIHWPDELERPNEVRREAQQPPPLSARLEDEMQIAVLEIAQPAVHQSRRSARRSAREVILLDERDS